MEEFPLKELAVYLRRQITKKLQVYSVPGNSLVVQCLELCSRCQGPGFNSLVGEIRSHKLRGVAKKTNKNKKLAYSVPRKCLHNLVT